MLWLRVIMVVVAGVIGYFVYKKLSASAEKKSRDENNNRPPGGRAPLR